MIDFNKGSVTHRAGGLYGKAPIVARAKKPILATVTIWGNKRQRVKKPGINPGFLMLLKSYLQFSEAGLWRP
ncbi:hypothetical protein NBRC116584_31820 [Hydrogenophaga sp. 5NK40-0174]